MFVADEIGQFNVEKRDTEDNLVSKKPRLDHENFEHILAHVFFRKKRFHKVVLAADIAAAKKIKIRRNLKVLRAVY